LLRAESLSGFGISTRPSAASHSVLRTREVGTWQHCTARRTAAYRTGCGTGRQGKRAGWEPYEHFTAAYSKLVWVSGCASAWSGPAWPPAGRRSRLREITIPMRGWVLGRRRALPDALTEAAGSEHAKGGGASAGGHVAGAAGVGRSGSAAQLHPPLAAGACCVQAVDGGRPRRFIGE
jgi:hypothetical protein